MTSKERVKSFIELCSKDGMHILSHDHNIQSDTSIANIEAFYDAARKYGKY